MRLSRLAISLALALSLSASACVRGGGRGSSPPERVWPSWQILEPLLIDAQHQVDKETFAAMRAAAELLLEQKAKSADAKLAELKAGAAPHWIAVARADLAALNFSTCVRGVAWRLSDGLQESRQIDFSPEARLQAGDISVEQMLTSLDEAIDHAQSANSNALLRHGRIARARVTAFVVQCPPNDEVAQQADIVLRADLATLAADGHLTPDLAYLWAGVQYEAYSPAAARPFLLKAAEEGYDDPSVDLLLASIALDAQDPAEADARATKALARYTEVEAPLYAARALSLRGEARRQQGKLTDALKDFELARKQDPMSAEAMVGAARVHLEQGDRSRALESLREGILALASQDALDEATLALAGERIESLVVLVNEELVLAELGRDALLHEIDLDDAPLRRGLRYYFAATLDVALGNYDAGRGHAVAAETEFEGEMVEVPDGIRSLLDRLAQLSG